MTDMLPIARPSTRILAPDAIHSAPDGEIRRGLIIAVVFFLVLLGGAALVRLDAAAYAPAVVSVSGQRQAVQHREGGTVGAVLVREGVHVRAGALLLTLSDPEATAEEQSLTTRYVSLVAERARISTEMLGGRHVPTPPEFATLAPAYRADATNALRLQQAQLEARLSKRVSQGAVLLGRKGQSVDLAQGYAEQLKATDQQIHLIDDELNGLRPLAEKGFVSQSRLRAMERARAELLGKREQFAATFRQTGGAGRENQLQQRQIDSEFRAGLVDEFNQTNAALDELWPRLKSSRDRLARGNIRATADGKVVGLSVFNTGSVVTPGQRILEIVPDRKSVIIEARVSPDNADDIYPGQGAEIRFPGIHVRSMPPLVGHVTMFSADRMVEDRTGAPYFLMHVEIDPSALQGWETQNEAGITLHPGMPAEIIIPLRKRTALQYIFEPLVGVFWKSLRED